MRTTVTFGFALAILLTTACGGSGASRSAGPMPQGGTFSGVWFSPQYGEMHMVQTGNAVVGEYTKDERHGRIQGTANGDLMRFEWTEERELVGGLPQTTRGRGYFRYVIDDSGKHNIIGEWGIDDDDSGGGDWNGYKLNRRQPQLSGDSGTSGSEDDNPDWNDTGESGGTGGGGDDWDDSGSSGGDEDLGMDDLDL